LRKERRLRVFDNRVVRKIFGPKWDEARGEWRKLNNDEINDLYCWSNIIRVIKLNGMDEAFRTYGGEERCIQSLVGKHEGKRPFGRPKLRLKDNIKIDLR
jgi:hypothetical protein